MGLAVGIDLGTTNTVVAAVKDGVVSTLADSSSRRLIPSTISFHPSGNVLVGYPALDRRLNDPENTIYSIKRLIGRAWDSVEVQGSKSRFPFALKEGAKHAVVVQARGEQYTLPEISAFVLRAAKATAEAALGETVDRAVITVPANFNDLQRAATKVAGKLAGLEVLRILNEPTAAALAYGQGASRDSAMRLGEASQSGERERIAIYDLGGGTFDITVLELSGSVFEVLATAGDMALGGDDIDHVICDKMAEDLLKKQRFDARTNPVAYAVLKVAAETVKRELSSREDFTIEIPEVAHGVGGRSIGLTYRMTRPELEWASLQLVERTFKVCEDALRRASLGVGEIDQILLVGGSTRMPLVARKVEQFFKKAPTMRVNPDEVVALGAAIQASMLDRNARRRGVAAGAPTLSSQSMVSASPADQSSRGDRDSATTGLPIVDADFDSSPRVPAAAPQGPAITFAKSDPVLVVAGLDSALPGPPRELPSSAKTLVFNEGVEAAQTRSQKAAVPDLEVPQGRSVARQAPAAPQASVAKPAPTGASVARKPPAAPPQSAPQISPPGLPSPVAAAIAGYGSSVTAPMPQAPARHPEAGAKQPMRAPLLIDVTPLTLSVETVGGFCDALIECNTPVPCDRSRVFSTASENQTAVVLRVAQGESKKFAENAYLGELELSGIPPGPRGEVRISVTFEIDADGILNIRAKEVNTGKETTARMQLFGAQTEAHEIAAMQARQARHVVGS